MWFVSDSAVSEAQLFAHGSQDRAAEALDETSDRRRFLVRAGTVTAAALALAGIPGVAQAGKVKVWKLNPGVNCDCTSCTACKNHAKYKIFATSAAADQGRAHPFCDCQIVQKKMRAACFRRLFGEKGDLKRTSVDKRRRRVQKVLSECS